MSASIILKLNACYAFANAPSLAMIAEGKNNKGHRKCIFLAQLRRNGFQVVVAGAEDPCRQVHKAVKTGSFYTRA